MVEGIETIIKKILSLEELPMQPECIKVMEHFESKKEGEWRNFCKYNGIYQTVHDELVNSLYRLISRLGSSNILEVCAGNGKLTYWLNKKGLNIKATDDHSWEHISKPDFVENLSCLDALKKYNPDLVIACFPCEETTVPIDVLNHSSVRFFIHLGNAERSYNNKSNNEQWGEKIKKMKGITRRGQLIEKIYHYPAFDDGIRICRCSNMLYTKL